MGPRLLQKLEMFHGKHGKDFFIFFIKPAWLIFFLGHVTDTLNWLINGLGSTLEGQQILFCSLATFSFMVGLRLKEMTWASATCCSFTMTYSCSVDYSLEERDNLFSEIDVID